MAAKSPWNTHTVLGIFHPRLILTAEMAIVSPLPPRYNVESIAEALTYLERHHFSLQCYSYHLQTTLLYGGGDFVVHLQHKSQEVFQDFLQTLYIKRAPALLHLHCAVSYGVLVINETVKITSGLVFFEIRIHIHIQSHKHAIPHAQILVVVGVTTYLLCLLSIECA